MECKGRAMMDEYTSLRTLGAGYHAKVKLAEDGEGRKVAIKKFKSTANLEVLRHELTMMSRLSHPNIVNLLGIR
jgi:serine/threonine protein kinase